MPNSQDPKSINSQNLGELKGSARLGFKIRDIMNENINNKVAESNFKLLLFIFLLDTLVIITKKRGSNPL